MSAKNGTTKDEATKNTKSWDEMTAQERDAVYDEYCQIVKQRYAVAPGEVTVYCGANVRSNTQSAYRKALELVRDKAFRKALVINTSSRQRWALALGRQMSDTIGSSGECDVIVRPSDEGLLSRSLREFETMVEHEGIDLVIINSWEYASCDARRREELIFRLRLFMVRTNVTVIVYSQAEPKEYTAGKILRGLGKLSGMAEIVQPVETSKPNEERSTVSEITAETTNTTSTKTSEKSEQYISEEGHLNGKRPKLIVDPVDESSSYQSQPAPEVAVGEEEAVFV